MNQPPEGPPAAADDAQPPAISRPQGAAIFVWLAWGMMTILAIAYVARYGSNVPSWDEWDMVPTLTGNQSVTWEWLWSQHNEHRVPVPRLLLLALNRPFGIDFRTAMYANVLLASALAAGAIVAARRVRGRTQWTDAVIPLLLLNLGQGLNFLWGWQIEFFASTTLAGAALLLILVGGQRPTTFFGLALGAILALLVGTGAHGVALVPAISSWLVLVGIRRWRDRGNGGRRDAVVLLVVALLGFVLTAAYFVGYERVPYHPGSPGKRASVVTAVQFLTMGFGPAVRLAIPIDTNMLLEVWPISGIAVMALLGIAGVSCIAAVVRRPGERDRALGLFCFLGAMGCLALGIGLGRDGFEPRYVTLSVPALLAAYLCLCLYAPPRLSVASGWVILAAAMLALWPNTTFGLAYARDLRANLAAFEGEVAAGVPPFKLIHDHGGWLHPHPDLVGDYLPMLRDAEVEPYTRLADNPPFREMRVELVPIETNELSWDTATATARAAGYKPHLTFAIDEPVHVAGIRLRYAHDKPSRGVPYVSVYWKNGQADVFDTQRFSKYSATGDHANWRRGTVVRLNDSESMMTVWVLDEIDMIRIHPDFSPCTFTIHELILLVLE